MIKEEVVPVEEVVEAPAEPEVAKKGKGETEAAPDAKAEAKPDAKADAKPDAKADARRSKEQRNGTFCIGQGFSPAATGATPMGF